MIKYASWRAAKFDFFDDTIINLLQQERLEIVKIGSDDFQFVQKIKELDCAVTDDDAYHLSCAINQKCQRFITLDNALLRDVFKSRIRAEFGLVISVPT